jgi:hypothetical protein
MNINIKNSKLSQKQAVEANGYFVGGTNIIYIYRSKAITVTGRGGLYVFPVRHEHHLHIQK